MDIKNKKTSFGVLFVILLLNISFLSIISENSVAEELIVPKPEVIANQTRTGSFTTYYVDYITGQDTNDGMSMNFPFKTLDKIRKIDILPGDTVLLKRGSIWNEPFLIFHSGTPQNSITIDAYGSGPNPMIDLSNNPPLGILISASYITIQNISMRNITGGGILCENSRDRGLGTWGLIIRNMVITNVSQNGILHYAGGKLLIENVTVTHAGNCGIALMGTLTNKLSDVLVRDSFLANVTANDGITIHEGGSDPLQNAGTNFTLENIWSEYCNEDGFDITSGDGILLLNCTSFRNRRTGIMVAHTAKNVTIRRHRSIQEPQASNTGASLVITVSHVTVTDSIFGGGNYHMVVIYPVYEPEIGDINLYNNLFLWSSGTMVQMRGVSSIEMQNNIFTTKSDSIGIISFLDTSHPPNDPNYFFNNNIYYSPNIDSYWIYDGNLINITEFRNIYGQEAQGKVVDPGFVDANSGDFRLGQYSPAIDSGSSISLRDDFDGNPIYGKRDIGPYEYQPPHKIGMSEIPFPSKIKLYEDLRFRIEEVDNSPDYLDFKFDLDMEIDVGANHFGEISDFHFISYDADGNRNIKWVENWLMNGSECSYQIGGLHPEIGYDIILDGVNLNRVNSDLQGVINFSRTIKDGKIEIDIIRNEIPLLIHHVDIGNYTAGDLVLLDVQGLDDEGISEVYIEYWFNEDPIYDNISISRISGDEKNGFWRGSILIPIDIFGYLNYRFKTVDVENNWYVTTLFKVGIIDLTLPTFSNDRTPTIVGTGNSFESRINIEDNIGISDVYFQFWIPGKVPSLIKMHLSDGYSAEIIAPVSYIGPMMYQFISEDLFGNQNSTEPKEIEIIDDDPPSLVRDRTLKVVIENLDMDIIAEFEDNIGMDSVKVEYWIKNGVHYKTRMKQRSERNYSLGISIPDGAEGSLYYKFEAMDGSGNKIFTSIFNSSIIKADEIDVEYVDIVSPLDGDEVNGKINVLAFINKLYLALNFYFIVNGFEKFLIDQTEISSVNADISVISVLWDTNNELNDEIRIAIRGYNNFGEVVVESNELTLIVNNIVDETVSLYEVLITPMNPTIFINEYTLFKVFAWDEYGEPIPQIFLEVKWYLLCDTGRIYDDGIFVPVRTGNCSVYVDVWFKGGLLSRSTNISIVSRIDSGSSVQPEGEKKTESDMAIMVIIIVIVCIFSLMLMFGVSRRLKRPDVTVKELRKSLEMEKEEFRKRIMGSYGHLRYSPYHSTLSVDLSHERPQGPMGIHGRAPPIHEIRRAPSIPHAMKERYGHYHRQEYSPYFDPHSSRPYN